MTIWTSTPRLELRRPSMDDLDVYTRLHTDPRTYAHAPFSMPTAEGCRHRLEGNVRTWEVDGIGYCAVVLRRTGEVIGWAGVRADDTEEVDAAEPPPARLNLYFRLAHDQAGAGLGREVARAVVAQATQLWPERTITAVARRVNRASLATCRRAGLTEVGTVLHPSDDPDGEPSVLLAAPRLVAHRTSDELPASDELLDLWCRVTDAGGSVGFLAGAARADVAAALDEHLATIRAGDGVLVTLRDAVPAGDRPAPLLGMGFWEIHPHHLQRHTATLYRLMVDPDHHGRNLGRILLDGMVGVAARTLDGVELLRLAYRSGYGLGTFYEQAGWTEVGRIPRALRVAPGDERDSVEMVRTPSGAPAPPRGGL